MMAVKELNFLVLLDVQTSYQERQKCNGVVSVCLQNTVMLQDTVNLSQLYISSKSNETKVRSLRRKNTSRIHKKNRRKNFQRKVHRHSTRVLSLKPASILLPPFENDIQQKNVSTLNPFIINVLANSKTSSSIENIGFSRTQSDQEKTNLNKLRQDIISTPESELNSTNSQDFNIVTTEHYKSSTVVPFSGSTHSDPESSHIPTDFQFLENQVKSTLPTEIESSNALPPPFLFLLPPFQEVENNILETQILEKPDDLKLPGYSTSHLETINSFSSNQQTATETSSTSLSVYKEFNQTASYNSHIPVTTQSIFDDFNKTEEVKKEDLYTNFNNTLLAPEVASLGMKIVTSRKGLEMIKELVTSAEPKSSTNHLQYDDSQSLLETAESGDVRSHTYNQLLSIEEANDVPKNMYKALKKPQKGFELCSTNQGYVADQSSGCQVFYICLGSGAGEPMMCPNGTLFNQEVLVCDWWYNVECSG